MSYTVPSKTTVWVVFLNEKSSVLGKVMDGCENSYLHLSVKVGCIQTCSSCYLAVINIFKGSLCCFNVAHRVYVHSKGASSVFKQTSKQGTNIYSPSKCDMIILNIALNGPIP